MKARGSLTLNVTSDRSILVSGHRVGGISLAVPASLSVTCVGGPHNHSRAQ